MDRTERDDWWEGIARLVGHPLRQRLLYAYAESVTSPSAFAEASGERLNVVSYHTQVLLRAGCIELVRTERRRGAVQHYYRALLGSVIDDGGWVRLPTRLRRALVRGAMDTSWREAADALPLGGMDDATAHVSRSVFALDDQGRADLAALLLATWTKAGEIEAASRRRGTDTEPRELVIFSFERASRP
jgi:DNA-binding transcriptional ArsR family regulator